MEIVVNSRNTEVSDRFREHIAEKLAKIEQFAPYTQRVEVEVIKETNPARAEESDRIEITVRDKGPTVRAEASSADRFSALDLASTKLFERLRRKHDRLTRRRKASLRDQAPRELPVAELLQESAQAAAAAQVAKEAQAIPTVPGEAVESQLGDSPVIVRQKLYEAAPISVDQAIYEMELVGHPFYLFIDEETKQPCAAYRRRGWTYGIIRLDATASNFGPGED
ncbi:MAG: ribosome-associated translation inhibitor RaiA [Trueperella sp.]|nr:ribosome-associated translation inhibitor RaiA [Trueperella sp.]